MESQLCWVGAGYEVVAGYVVRSMVGRLVVRVSDGYGSCLVPRWLELPLVPYSVRWCWDKCPLQGPQWGLQTVDLFPGVWQV